MDTENRSLVEENEVTEAAEQPAEVTEAAEQSAAEQPRKESSKRIKKAQRREAKAARKAANKIEEKNSRPNNALIAILIFGVVIAMFAFVLGYNYFSKPATIAKYIEDNGGEEAYGSIMLDAYTTAAITAEGNSMNIEVTSATDDENVAQQIRDYYGGEDGKEQVEYLASYFLTGIKPQTRALSADVKASFKLNDEELNTAELTYKEAKALMEAEEEEAEEASDGDEASDKAADDAAEAEGDAADAAEDAAEEEGN